MVNKTKTSNGLRIITIPLENSKTVTILVLVGIGSKYERKELNGISHFLEHMLFKGTDKRSNPKDVAETIDKIGGSYNAFTGEEYTGYYVKVASSHFDTALDWISDIFINSKIPAQEVEKEKGVIIEEINMIKDHPMNYVQQVWTNLLYDDQPAGWDIAGTKESVTSIARGDLKEYKEKNYVTSGTIVCVAGNINPDIAREKVEKAFINVKEGEAPSKESVIENQAEPQALVENRETDQPHLCLGVRAYDIFHPKRRVLNIIETVLGKMMSSRLFVKIREELGLAYYVRTSYDSYTDTGFVVTQAGVDNRNVGRAVEAIIEEYNKMTTSKVPPEELKKAKENIKGRLAISLETSDAQAYFFGNQELLKGEIDPIEKIFDEIDKVREEDVLTVSKDIFRPENLNLAVVGSINQDELKNMIKR